MLKCGIKSYNTVDIEIIFLYLIETMKPVPLSFETWCYENNIEDMWHALKSEYGDSVPLLSAYKEFEYSLYLQSFY